MTLRGTLDGHVKHGSLRKADIAGGEADTETSSENNTHNTSFSTFPSGEPASNPHFS